MKYEFFTKGRPIYVDRNMRLEEFKTQDGLRKTVPKIYAEVIALYIQGLSNATKPQPILKMIYIIA